MGFLATVFSTSLARGHVCTLGGCFALCCRFRDYSNELQTLLTVKEAQFQAHHTDIWNLGFALMCFSSV